jgi:hypothetical protein
MLPQGYSTDTSLIGKGKPAIVLIYDSDNLVSDQLMASFNQVRDTYGNQIEFLLVDLNAPGGRQFANTNGVTTASALFFSPEGRQVAVAHGAHEKEMLEDAIRRKFNLP